jgi:tRNA(Ile)-lysidine synthase
MAGSRKSPSTDPLAAVAAALSLFVRPGQSLTVALSGGVDSVVLLDVVRRSVDGASRTLRALHVDHGLSPDSAQWAAFCGRLCQQWGIPLCVERVRVDLASGRGLEAAAREARYGAFASAGTDWLLTAHNCDDQVETVFLNLLRGAGPRGLAGMPTVGAERLGGEDGPRLLRPLLDVPRQAILAYAGARNLGWVEDQSNRDTDFRRNFLRHEILPLLARGFPGFESPLLRGAHWSAEAAELLDVLAAADLQQCRDGQGRVDVRALANMDDVRARNLLRFWLRSQGLRAPDSARLAEILRQLTAAAPDAAVRIDVDGRAVRRYRGWVAVAPIHSHRPPQEIPWNGEARVPWAGGAVAFQSVHGAGIDASLLRLGAAALRVRRGHERLRLDAARPRRSLKNLFQEASIPPWEREILPLLWCGGDLVWVAGVGIAAQFRCPPGADGWLPTWIPD